ncbi:S26 family signal peptidase [Microbacterium timonense]|uniref:S26 family signal peptidase n=1 Tax=Microbacterium timonense TaxID=2086576 RepID=UPI000D10E8E5|nr:S26 family signal peptidase [Microbacterium timonense]
MAPRQRSAWGRAGDAALAVAAVLGAVCIVLAIAAAVFDVRIVLFRTGSMSPTIPAGSAAIVHGIPADQVGVGDVVMVDRPGQLPVTHRVVAVEPAPDAADARLLTLRGDANPVNDPAPYRVTEVRRVVTSAPGVAPVLASLGSPWVLGSVTIAATVLIVAVFWPRRRARPAAGDAVHSRAPAPATPSRDAPAGAEADAAASTPAPGSRRARRAAGTAVAVALIAGTAAGPAPAPARADGMDTVIQGSVIRLVSIEDPAMQQLSPGGSAVWQVGGMADADSPGTVTVSLSGTAADETALRYTVTGCPQRWSGDICVGAASGSDELITDAPVPTDGQAVPLEEIPDDRQLWLRVEVQLPADADPIVPPVQLTVRATGVGDDVTTGPVGGLAATGGTARWAPAAMATVVIAIGAGLVLRGKRRS